jgi:hypothetical protein
MQIVDENGRNVNEASFKESGVRRTHGRLYELGMGAVIWGIAVVTALGGLYGMSLLSGD